MMTSPTTLCLQCVLQHVRKVAGRSVNGN